MPAPDPLLSFEAFVHASNSALSRVAYLRAGDHLLAEDLVQRALLDDLVANGAGHLA